MRKGRGGRRSGFRREEGVSRPLRPDVENGWEGGRREEKGEEERRGLKSGAEQNRTEQNSRAAECGRTDGRTDGGGVCVCARGKEKEEETHARY